EIDLFDEGARGVERSLIGRIERIGVGRQSVDRSGQIHNVGTGLDFPEKTVTTCLCRRASGDEARNRKDGGKSREDTGALRHVLVIGRICRVQKEPAYTTTPAWPVLLAYSRPAPDHLIS